jgi:hypothetical protein
MRVINNYLRSWTESLRESLAWKIFPEMNFYIEAARRMAQLDENRRCVKALQDADSACEGWAVDTIEIKLNSLDIILKKFKEEGFDEPPF